MVKEQFKVKDLESESNTIEKVINLFWLIMLIILFCTSCKKENAQQVDMGYNYVPIAEGNYVIYDVDSVFIDKFNKKKDTSKFQLKEEIGNSFHDLTGNLNYEYKRYKRFYKNNADINKTPWILTDVWYVKKTKDRFERIEESFRYTRLKFPVMESSQWNGNAFNTNPIWNYTLKNVDTKLTIGKNTFDSTSTVLQRDYTSEITKEYYLEIFARNIGLIYKKVIDVKSQDNSKHIKIMDKLDEGVIYEWTYLSHGKIN